jgi:ATP-binding cassette subfamily E protein 1
MSKKNIRVAIINKDRCKPNKCNFECGLVCPPNRQGKECIKLVNIEDSASTNVVIGSKKKTTAIIIEDACISCGICVKVCPFSAIILVNVPTELSEHIIHRYGQNGFRLYKMPLLKQGKIFGIIGQNGIGKSSIMQMLANKMKPNFEEFNKIYSDDAIIAKFKGTEMFKYMTRLYNNDLKVSIKPQQIDMLIKQLQSKNLDPTFQQYIDKKNEYDKSSDWYKLVINTLELFPLLNSNVITSSGGELQRLVCCTILLCKSDVYIFDEFTNFLDVRQKLNVATMIEKLLEGDGFNRYVVIVEHDLAILDYVSDYICILYGTPSAYGVVSQPLSTANGINTYFDGYIKSENMRFRQREHNLISLDVCESIDMKFNDFTIKYDPTTINYNNFKLNIMEGVVPVEGSLNIILGSNGTGKTTLIEYISRTIGSTVSYKPQYLSIDQFKENEKWPTVEDFLMNNIKTSYVDELFRSDVMIPMNIENIAKRKLDQLSGGELQRFWLVYCLGQNHHIYLIDEPSSMLDIEQRIIVTKVIKKFIVHNRKIAFIVEHDMMMAVSLGNELNANTIIVEKVDNVDNVGNGVRESIAYSPTKFNIGLNRFLKSLDITFRTDDKNKRPRINKLNSIKDKEQKANNKYYV